MITARSPEMAQLQKLISEMNKKIKTGKWTRQAYRNLLRRAKAIVGDATELLEPFVEAAAPDWRSRPTLDTSEHAGSQTEAFQAA